MEGQLTGVAITKNGKITTVQENEYNGDGQRISKTDNGIKTYYYYEGSTSVITDDEGDCIESYEYTDFGEPKKCGNTDFYNEICYTGGVYDETTGLYYLNARYYDPEDGVFLSQDTYRGEATDSSSWNLYA